MIQKIRRICNHVEINDDDDDRDNSEYDHDDTDDDNFCDEVRITGWPEH